MSYIMYAGRNQGNSKRILIKAGTEQSLRKCCRTPFLSPRSCRVQHVDSRPQHKVGTVPLSQAAPALQIILNSVISLTQLNFHGYKEEMI